MTTSIVTGFRLDDDDHRTLHYSSDPDLKLTLNGTLDTTFVLVALDVDVQASYNRDVDTELLDRAIATLTLARDALGRTE